MPLSAARRLRHPRTTVRGRLTLLYGALFLACGAALLGLTYLLVDRTFPSGNSSGGGPTLHNRCDSPRRPRGTPSRQTSIDSWWSPSSRWPSWWWSRSLSAGSSPDECSDRS
ncbi:MAG: hypothetical protein M0Z30_18010, partial [Actinomycetota bacterium]|nr:hypothetical protein [Actinomycetota bacterium]